jgi:hypothetical protein
VDGGAVKYVNSISPLKARAVFDYRIRIPDFTFVGLRYAAEKLAKDSLGLFDITSPPSLWVTATPPNPTLSSRRMGKVEISSLIEAKSFFNLRASAM